MLISQQELFMAKRKKDIFDTEKELKNNPDIKTDDFKDRVRYPQVMDVHKIEFEPAVPLLVVTRTSYDLLLNEDAVTELHAMLSEWLKTKHYKDARIRFVGDVTDK